VPDDKIEPYNLTFNKMRDREVKDWSEKFFKQMQKRIDLDEISSVLLHAGNKYRKHLIPKLKALEVECKVPLAKMKIGEQRRWYKTRDC